MQIRSSKTRNRPAIAEANKGEERMNRRTVLIIVVTFGMASVALLLFGIYTSLKAQVQPAPQAVRVVEPRPITDVKCGWTYHLDHLERFYVHDRVAVNFTFGGADRNRQPQYIWDRNVIGQSTEIRSARRVDRSLAYSLVTFLCLSDAPLEGHEASNVEVMRYRLTLRRPLRQQRVIRYGGPARQ